MDNSTNPKDVIGRTKPPLELCMGPALLAWSMVMRLGAIKYGRFNWRQYDVSASVYVGAALRHIFSWFDGEDVDPESGQTHLAHAMACLAILIDAKSVGKLVDDRPTPGGTADAIRQAVTAVGTQTNAGAIASR